MATDDQPRPGGHPQIETLSAWVDQALPADEAAHIAAHLGACPRCSSRRRSLEALRRAVKGLAPPGSRAALDARGAAGHTARHRAAPSKFAAALAAAVLLAVALAAVILVGRIDRRGPGPSPQAVAPVGEVVPSDTLRFLLHDYHDYANRSEAAALKTDSPGALTAWFDREARVPFDVPDLSGARLLGGRRCSILGRAIALAFYRYHGRWVALYGIPLRPGETADSVLSGLPRGCAATRDALSICTRVKGRAVIALISALPTGVLRSLLEPSH